MASKPKQQQQGFWTPQPVQISDAVWRQLDFRGRLRAWTHQQLNQPNPFPLVAAALYAVKLPAWGLIFHRVFRDRKQSLSAELNVKRWILFNILYDVLGFGATSGPLGFKFNVKIPCETWWYFLSPGTLTLPLVPSLGGIRSKALVAMFVAYIFALLRALRAPRIGFKEVGPALALLASLIPFDVLPFFASRGEHYVYQAICLAFPGQQWKFGCQMVQLALWTGAGLSKVGPWFKHVVSFMMPNCVFFSGCIPTIRRLLQRDPPHDLRPSLPCRALALGGTLAELGMGWLCVFEPTRKWGVRLALIFHSYIISQTPIASVFEWNIYSMLMTNHLFGGETGVVWPQTLSPALGTFLLTALVCVPTVGQFFPSKVPFLMAYRPYAGNWRGMWVVFPKSAVPRLKRLKTFNSPLAAENAQAMLGTEYTEHFDYIANASMMSFPNYRALPSIVEALMKRQRWNVDEVNVLAHVPFENYVCGWSLFIGWGVFRDVFRQTVQQVCAFGTGECFFVQFEPMGLLSRTMQWRVIDVSNGMVVFTGQNKYEDLEELTDPISFVAKVD